MGILKYLKKHNNHKLKKIIIYVLTLVVFSNSFYQFGFATYSSVAHDGLFYIKNVNSGKYLTATSTGNIVQQTKNYNDNQRFFIRQSAYEGYYTLTPDSDNSLRVDIENASNSDNTNVKTFTKNDDHPEAQCFKFIINSDGSYKIMPKLSTTRVLDVANASISDNANVQLFTKHADSSQYATAQNWFLYKAAKSLLSWDLVDSGKHLDYYADDSAYKSYVETAVSVWNGHKQGVIREDNLLRTREVEVVDFQTLENASGLMDPNGTLKINSSFMNSVEENKKINLLVHEIGHALGMGHITGKNNVMSYVVNTKITLTESNTVSYDMAYDRY